MKPFSEKEKGIIVRPLDDRFYYAFNFNNPSGIKILSHRAAKRLIAITEEGDSYDKNNKIDSSIIKSGLFHKTNTASDKMTHLSVWLHVTNSCNLSCYYCYIPNLRKTADSDTIHNLSMKLNDAKTISHRLISYCEEREIKNLHVKFAGGEPTLDITLIREFCREISKQPKKVNVSYGMITNGVFNANQVIPILKEFDITLSVSIDGYKSTHDDIRFHVINKRKNGTWDLIWANIENLLSVGIMPYLLYTITPSNINDIHKFSDLAHKLNLGYRLSLERSKKLYEPEIKKKVVTKLTELYCELGRNMNYELPISRYARFSEWNLKKKKNLACSAGRNYIAISQRGYVSSCQMGMNNKYGNIMTDGLELPMVMMKKNGYTSIIAKPILRNGICNSCEYYYVCSGGCPEHTVNTFGTIDTLSPWCTVFGSLIPVYMESIARQMLRKIRSKK